MEGEPDVQICFCSHTKVQKLFSSQPPKFYFFYTKGLTLEDCSEEALLALENVKETSYDTIWLHPVEDQKLWPFVCGHRALSRLLCDGKNCEERVIIGPFKTTYRMKKYHKVFFPPSWKGCKLLPTTDETETERNIPAGFRINAAQDEHVQDFCPKCFPNYEGKVEIVRTENCLTEDYCEDY